MRPRPGGRGEPEDTRILLLRQLPLQCGHDPEAVESTGVAVRPFQRP